MDLSCLHLVVLGFTFFSTTMRLTTSTPAQEIAALFVCSGQHSTEMPHALGGVLSDRSFIRSSSPLRHHVGDNRLSRPRNFFACGADGVCEFFYNSTWEWWRLSAGSSKVPQGACQEARTAAARNGCLD